MCLPVRVNVFGTNEDCAPTVSCISMMQSREKKMWWGWGGEDERILAASPEDDDAVVHADADTEFYFCSITEMNLSFFYFSPSVRVLFLFPGKACILS